MTDLEFIENEMECCEIDFVCAQKREDKILTRYFKERYEQLKQIKAKLEAWKEYEKELGCPLEVLFKAFKDGIFINKDGYVNDAEDNYEFDENEDSYYSGLNLSYCDDYCLNDIYHPYGDSCCGDIGCSVKLKDYQKTWWLEKPKALEVQND